MIRAKRLPASFDWNYDRVELIADGAVHTVGVVLGLIGAIAIVVMAAQSAAAAKIPSVVIYAIGLLAMLGLSAAYNMWPISRVKWILQRFDHSAIYIMIAGTYTPFLGQLKDSVVSVGLLVVVWATAIFGVALKLLMPGRFNRLAMVLYLLLGWSCAAAYGPVTSALPPVCLGLL